MNKRVKSKVCSNEGQSQLILIIKVKYLNYFYV